MIIVENYRPRRVAADRPTATPKEVFTTKSTKSTKDLSTLGADGIVEELDWRAYARLSHTCDTTIWR